MLRIPLRFIPAGIQLAILQGPLRGKSWIVGSSTHGCWLGSYESQKQRVFCLHVKSGDTVWDLGANAGYYSLLASGLVGPSGHVFSFEPLPRNLFYLRKHLEMNGVRNCKVLDLSVGERDGMCGFEIAGNPSEGHCVDQINAEAGAGLITVQEARLDSLVGSGNVLPPDVIKCDIEGAEFGALRGAVETLIEYRPIILLATHGHQAHGLCCDFLSELRYKLISLDERSMQETDEILALPDELHLRHIDCLSSAEVQHHRTETIVRHAGTLRSQTWSS